MKSTLAIVAVATLAGSTFADTINATFTGVSPSQVVTVRLNGDSMQTRAGLFNFDRVNANPGTFTGVGDLFSGFCIDLTEYVQANQSYTWHTVPMASAPTSSAGPMSANDVVRLGRLFANNYNALATSANPNQSFAAFQLAVWEIVHDSGLNLESGDLRVTSAPEGTRALAQGWLNSLGSGSAWTLIAIDNPVSEDCEPGQQGYVMVPAPGAAALIGLGALAAGRRRR